MSRRANVSLWIVQSLLAALFLFAGGMKLALPAAALFPVAVGALAAVVAYGRSRTLRRSAIVAARPTTLAVPRPAASAASAAA